MDERRFGLLGSCGISALEIKKPIISNRFKIIFVTQKNLLT